MSTRFYPDRMAFLQDAKAALEELPTRAENSTERTVRASWHTPLNQSSVGPVSLAITGKGFVLSDRDRKAIQEHNALVSAGLPR